MFEVKRVLCPVDLTELSIRPLAYAGAIANWYRAQLTALHVVPTFEPMEVRAGALFDPVQFVYPMSREQVLERLREAVHTAGAIDQVDVAAEAGEPAAIIVDQASARPGRSVGHGDARAKRLRSAPARFGHREGVAEGTMPGPDRAASRGRLPCGVADDDSVPGGLLTGRPAGRRVCGGSGAPRQRVGDLSSGIEWLAERRAARARPLQRSGVSPGT